MADRPTERQLECLRLSATMTDKQISRALGISHHTVGLHIREAKRRLGVNSRKAALQRLTQEPLYAFRGMSAGPMNTPDAEASADQANDAVNTFERRHGWILPPPPSTALRLAFVLIFAAIAALMTVGIVQAISGALTAFEVHAPPSTR